MGRFLAHQDHLPRDVPELEQPELVPRVLICVQWQNLLTVGEAKPVAQHQGVSQAHVLLSNRALEDKVTRLQAEMHIPLARLGNGRRDWGRTAGRNEGWLRVAVARLPGR